MPRRSFCQRPVWDIFRKTFLPMFRMKAVVGVAFRPMFLGKCWMAESAELSSLFDDSCFKITVSEAVFPNCFRIKLNVRSLNMRQTQHCLHFSIALNACQRHTELRAFVSWCASWQAPTPSSWISRCQPWDHWKLMALTWTPSPPWLPAGDFCAGNFKRAVFCGVSSQSSHEFDAWEPQHWWPEHPWPRRS